MLKRKEILLILTVILIFWVIGYSLRQSDLYTDEGLTLLGTDPTQEILLLESRLTEPSSLVPFWSLSPADDFVKMLDMALDGVERIDGDAGLWHIQAVMYPLNNRKFLRLLIDRNEQEIRGSFGYPIIYDINSDRFYVQDADAIYDADLNTRINDFLILWSTLLSENLLSLNNMSLDYSYDEYRVVRFSLGVLDDTVSVIESSFGISWNNPQIWFYMSAEGIRSDSGQHSVSFYDNGELIAEFMINFLRTQHP